MLKACTRLYWLAVFIPLKNYKVESFFRLDISLLSKKIAFKPYKLINWYPLASKGCDSHLLEEPCVLAVCQLVGVKTITTPTKEMATVCLGGSSGLAFLGRRFELLLRVLCLNKPQGGGCSL